MVGSFSINKNSKEIIEKIFLSRKHHLFFSNIRQSKFHRKLFFLHRNDLFIIDTDTELPYFFLFPIPVKRTKGLQHIVFREMNISKDSKNIVISLLGNLNVDVTRFLEDFMDIIIYFLIYFIRSNKELKNLIISKEFNYKKMKSIIKDYKNINIDENINELAKSFREEDGKIDNAIVSKIKKVMSLILLIFEKNLGNLIESSKKMMPNIFLSFHLFSREMYLTILTKGCLSEQEYLDILDDLYMNKLIANESTIFWCENCILESPSYGEYHGGLAPSNIIKTNCKKCGKSQSYSCIFSIDDLIKDAIFSNDGFLSIYFGWLLKNENISFTLNEYSSEYEYDFIINNRTLIECKMFKREKDQEAIKSELESAIIQIKNHLESLNKEKKKIKNAYLIWNRYEDIHIFIKKFKTKYDDLFKNYGFNVFGPENLEELISRLKEN